MKKLIVLAVALSLLLAGCGHPLETKKMTYPTYGLFNEGSSKSKNVCYEISVGNVVWSIILIETVVMPIYFVGWSLYNPVRLKRSADDQCTLDS